MKYFVLVILLFTVAFGSAQTIIHKEDKFGLIDSSGTYVLGLEYSDIHELLLYEKFKTNLYLYKKENKYGLYNGRTKSNTGLVLDEIVLGHRKGTYAFRTGHLWGFIIEPELHQFDWVMPKYKEVVQYSEGLPIFVGDPYFVDYYKKGYSVRVDSHWGYASYKEDKLLIPMQFKNCIERSSDSQGSLYKSCGPNTRKGYLIHNETFAFIEVSDVVMAKRFGDYFVDDYYLGDTRFIRIQNLRTAQKISDQEQRDFESSNIHYKLISADIMEFSGEAKRKSPRMEEDQLRIWYDLNTGEEMLRLKIPNCRELELGDDDKTEVWSVVECGGGNSKIIGYLSDRKFVKK